MEYRQRRVRWEKGELQKKILRLLYRVSPRRFSELKKLVESRSNCAIQYALKVLIKKGFVEKKGNEYYITERGKLFLIYEREPPILRGEELEIKDRNKQEFKSIFRGAEDPPYSYLISEFIEKVEKSKDFEGLKGALLDEKYGLYAILRTILSLLYR